MCDSSPGLRCSDYASSTYNITKKRLTKITTEREAYSEKYAASLANTENPSPRDLIRQKKYARLLESEKEHQRIVDGAEFEYYSCPAGQVELEEDLAKAIEEEDVVKQEEIEARIEAGKEYRARNRQNLRDLEAIEAEEGPEAAAEAGWQKYEEAVEVETEAAIQMEKSQAELEAARAEHEEYERAMNEYRSHNRIDTPEEEAEKAHKKKLQLIIIGTIAAAVIAYSLTRQAATGEKSQLMQYGKSMMMRQVMTGGRQYLMPMLTDGDREEDMRELRAEREAEHRATLAREKVIRRHEQRLAEEERRKLRDEERMADLAYKNALREADREAEREKRREEIAHYERLAQTFKNIPLTPEMQAEIDSKKPTRPQRSGSRNSDGNRGGNGSGRQRSTRRQGQPDVAGAATRQGAPAGNAAAGAATHQTAPAAGKPARSKANSDKVTQQPVPTPTQALPVNQPANA